MTKKTVASDLASSALNMRQILDYDSQQHLISSISIYTESNNTISQVIESFKYDKNGNIVKYNRNKIESNYSYNDLA